MKKIVIDGKVAMSRYNDGAAKVRNHMNRGEFDTVYLPSDKPLVHTNTDVRRCPFLEDIANWAETTDKIRKGLLVNLAQLNPEEEVFHPASLINEILGLVEGKYSKEKDEINEFMNVLTKEDFHTLFKSTTCTTFNNYWEALEINTVLNVS